MQRFAGVVVAALLIAATGLSWIDPLTSLLIAAVIVVGTWGVLRDSVNLAMDGVPPESPVPTWRLTCTGCPA